MASPKIYPKGLRFFQRNENAPDFVKGTLLIVPNELVKWLKENESLLTEYKGEKQLNLQILEGDKGLYAIVNTYKPSNNAPQQQAPITSSDDIPF